jgi:serine/threonine-protein kinase RsbW
MQILDFRIEAFVLFDAVSIEKVTVLCEEAIIGITSNEKARFNLKSAINELLVNSLEHGYNKQSGKVCINIRRDAGSVFIEICDEGSGIDLDKINLNRNITELDTVTERGWGLAIINKLSLNMKVSRNYPKGTIISLNIPI